MKRLIIICALFSIVNSSQIYAEEPTQKITEQPHYVYLNEKSPYIAVGLSSLLGFGTGDFYAQNIPFGVVSATVECIGIGLFVTSWIKIDDDADNFMERSELKGSNFDSNEKIWFYSSLGTWIGARIFGSITGAISANNHNKNIEKRFRYQTSKITPIFVAGKDNNFAGFSISF